MIRFQKILSIVITTVAIGYAIPTYAQDNRPVVEVKDSTKIFQKALLIAFVKDEPTRKIAEDKLADELKGRGIASYKYLGTIDTRTSESVLSDQLKQDGFDGVVLMKLAVVDKNKQAAPGNTSSPGSSWYGAYSNTYPMFANPNNYPVGKVYNVEINVYSLVTDKLIWKGTTSAVNTSNTGKMIDQIIIMTKQQMKSQGFIK